MSDTVVTTTALIAIDMSGVFSPETPGLFVGSRQIGEIYPDRDGTPCLFTQSEHTGMFTVLELENVDVFAAVAHLYPVAEEIVRDELEYLASLERYRADRRARGLAPNMW